MDNAMKSKWDNQLDKERISPNLTALQPNQKSGTVHLRPSFSQNYFPDHLFRQPQPYQQENFQTYPQNHIQREFEVLPQNTNLYDSSKPSIGTLLELLTPTSEELRLSFNFPTVHTGNTDTNFQKTKRCYQQYVSQDLQQQSLQKLYPTAPAISFPLERPRPLFSPQSPSLQQLYQPSSFTNSSPLEPSPIFATQKPKISLARIAVSHEAVKCEFCNKIFNRSSDKRRHVNGIHTHCKIKKLSMYAYSIKSFVKFSQFVYLFCMQKNILSKG